ncbi:hypothetical protein HYH03_002931 [Edaphochlamys debaryana]|uniref:Uncharacterized protein n=1 Tax=Edaphochlamys debaryana TaxID=47281 RepID=A0A835YED6_9CHLO|nr:hypothetical protein HYH03_002931 [Edaphochlamys debaryana]|eukprot:KAG2499356.1 hypothetical protein HYH03_002931 [Edaphochlamys debaryana]
MGKQQAGGPKAGPIKTFKYGMPLYGLAWPAGDTFYVCGGGGAVSSGIKNRLVCAEATGGSLTDQTGEFHFGLDCPTRLIVSPDAKSIVFAMGKGGIQRLDMDVGKGKPPKFTEVTGAIADRCKAIKIPDVKAMAFHPSGELLALGGDDGSLVVYEWPSLKVKLDLSGDKKMADAVKDLAFAPHAVPGPNAPASSAPAPSASGPWRGSGRALVAVLDNGSAHVLDLDRGGALLCKAAMAKGPEFKSDKVMLITSEDRLLLHHLPPGMESAQFTRVTCRGAEGERPTLVCLMNNRAGCHVALWELGDDGLLSMRAACRAAEAPGACLDATADGGMAAVCTSEGDVVLVACRPHVRVLKRFPKQHMVFTTCITFSADGAHVLSTAADASATINSTAVAPPPDLKKILFLILIFLAIVMMCLRQFIKVMKAQGYSHEEIRAMLGFRPKTEL